MEASRIAAARVLLDELVYYFGLEMTDAVFEAQVSHIRSRGGMDL
jgi:hypothetical protein